MPTREPRWRWAVPLRLRPLRMTDLSAGECLVRLTDRADTPYSRLLRSLTFRTALRCVIDSATPAVQGGLLTAGAGMHPARCTGIGLVLRPQPDPDVTQARCSIGDCPATPCIPPGTHDDSTHLVSPLHSLRAPLFSLRSGVSVL